MCRPSGIFFHLLFLLFYNGYKLSYYLLMSVNKIFHVTFFHTITQIIEIKNIDMQFFRPWRIPQMGSLASVLFTFQRFLLAISFWFNARYVGWYTSWKNCLKLYPDYSYISGLKVLRCFLRYWIFFKVLDMSFYFVQQWLGMPVNSSVVKKTEIILKKSKHLNAQ